MIQTKILGDIFLCLMICGAGKIKNDPFEKWESNHIALCNTAKNCDYYSEEEKKVILLINLVRTNPALFCETYLKKHKQKYKVKNTSYYKSLVKTLKSIHPMSALSPDKSIYEAANSHAIASGKKGSSGHQNFDKRKDQSNCDYFGENCSYGYSDAENIVMQLLIDEGVKSLGHRENILNESYSLIGLGIAKHKVWKWNCVIDFGSR